MKNRAVQWSADYYHEVEYSWVHTSTVQYSRVQLSGHQCTEAESDQPPLAPGVCRRGSDSSPAFPPVLSWDKTADGSLVAEGIRNTYYAPRPTEGRAPPLAVNEY